MTHLNLTLNLIGGVYQSGALFSYGNSSPNPAIIRVGVSFVSAEQACANAESEVGTTSFEEIHQRSVDLWNEKLGKIEIDVGKTDPNVTELLYSSVYRSNLTPNNATGEGQGRFLGTTSPYFDSLYCSWDTVINFLTYHATRKSADIFFISTSSEHSILGCHYILLEILQKLWRTISTAGVRMGGFQRFDHYISPLARISSVLPVSRK